MDLIFWRHAEAIDLELVGDDMMRYLSSRGEKQAARMAAWLDRQLPDGAKILVSPALRAQQTAKALERKFKVCPELAPLANVEQLLELVQWPHSKACVLVVGHQPTLGQAIARILDIRSTECAVRKGAVWWLRFRVREPESHNLVVTVQSPEML